VFCDLVETESFTKAAGKNGVTQSAVTQQLAAMERFFKSPLIERRSSGMVHSAQEMPAPTPAPGISSNDV
jgi:DNA-binding transcriptional LysR family regulator